MPVVLDGRQASSREFAHGFGQVLDVPVDRAAPCPNSVFAPEIVYHEKIGVDTIVPSLHQSQQCIDFADLSRIHRNAGLRVHPDRDPYTLQMA